MRRRNFNGLSGLSGHASSMISSLKNNSRRKELEHFKASKKKTIYKTGKIEKKATPEQLEEIRERIQKENKKNFTITLILWVTAVIVLFILFNYVKF